jgi:hypothetical protein
MEEDSILYLRSFARIAWRSSFWPLDSQAGVLFLYLVGFKASSLHMLSLAFHKMMFIFFKSLHLFFVIGYGFAVSLVFNAMFVTKKKKKDIHCVPFYRYIG